MDVINFLRPQTLTNLGFFFFLKIPDLNILLC